MEFLQPATWSEALAMKSAHPEALPIAGGTDVMVEINFDRQRPLTIIDLTRIADLTEWGMAAAHLRIAAAATYPPIIPDLLATPPPPPLPPPPIRPPQLPT